MQKKYSKSFFKKMTKDKIHFWIETHKKRLIGSAIFAKGTGIGAKLVVWAEKWTCKDKGFCPSHTGSIVEKDGKIFIFDMKPPKASTQNLESYLCTTKEDFVLVLRDFKLDSKMFSSTILEHVGQNYPYWSAIQSVFSKRQTKWNNHCSELHLRKLQLQGLFPEINAEITPDELFHLFCNTEGDMTGNIIY